MKKNKIAGLLIGIFILLGIVYVTNIADAAVLDKVTVVVNDEVVTQREFDRAFLPMRERLEANFKGAELERRLGEVEKGVMEHLINTKLAISLAKKNEIEIDETELKNRIEKIKKYYGTEEAFLKALNDRGTNYTEFERDIREQMMAQMIVDKEVTAKVVIGPSEISDLYDENKEQMISPVSAVVKSIMVRKAADIDAGRKKIEDLRAKLVEGENFGMLAETASEGPYAEKGGDMGRVIKGQLLPEMDTAIFATSEGDISAIIETPVGFHLFLVEDIEQARQLELAEVSDFLRNQLFRKKFEEKLAVWMEEKRKDAYISYK